jgi:hypothetical protein
VVEKHAVRKLHLLLPVVIAATACSSTDNGSIDLVTGAETDTFTEAPAPTQLIVSALDSSGNSTTLATASLPTSSIDLGTQSEANVAIIEVKGTDANGNELVFGASLPIDYGDLAGTSLPIFVQRSNQFARMPNPPSDTRQAPTLAVLAGEFLFIGGGSDAGVAETSELYDFGGLTTISPPPPLPRAPLSMPVMSGTVGLLLDSNGGTYYDFSVDSPTDVSAPAGSGFGDVAGGQSVYDDTDGTIYVVGATRTQGAETAAVLFINPNDTSNASYPYGNMTWLTLSSPRLGATATWVDGTGLVVTGGSATAAGVEVVAAGQSTGKPLPFPPDDSIGAGATELDSEDLLVAGGVTPTGSDAGARELDLSCTASCTAMTWTALPLPVTSASAFWLGSGGQYTALLVGSEIVSGLTHAYLLNSTSATEVATRVPHTNAQAIVSPVGSVVLFGGAGEIESFWPTL